MITEISHEKRGARADHGGVVLVALPLAVLAALGSLLATMLQRGSRANRRGALEATGPRRPDSTSWLSLPAVPRATTAEDSWVLEAFDAGEIAELQQTDHDVRRDLSRDHHALVLARVPEHRRDRRVRLVAWAERRLTLVLGDGTAVEFDGVPQRTATWLAYCHQQFGLVVETIAPAEATWAARLESYGCDTPVRASRLRVS